MTQEDQNAAAVLRWRNDPEAFIVEVLGVETLEPWQISACKEVAENDRISFKACHDVGKTWFMARIFLWFFITRENSKILTTAPTWLQVEKLLWAEINSAVTKSKYPLGGRCLTVDYKISDDWFAVGLSPKHEVSSGEGQGKQSTFQGFHAPHLMVIFDEATGVRPVIWDLAEGNLTSGETKFLAIGNPTSRSSRFFSTFKDITWKNISIPCFVSPNLKANKIFDMRALEKEYNYLKSLTKTEVLERLKSYKMVNNYLLSLKWTMEKALKWGLKHPLFVSKVLGEFPLEDENSLITLATVEAAQNRDEISGEQIRFGGADVARFGTDRTVFTEFLGFNQTRAQEHFQADGTEVVGELFAFFDDGNSNLETHISIDGGNTGGHLIDDFKALIKEKGKRWRVYEVQFGASFHREDYPKGIKGEAEFVHDKEHYLNQKARMFALLAEDLKENITILSNVMSGMDEVYSAELPEIKYKLNGKSKIQIQSKDEYKADTGNGSPDFSDSLALANYSRHIKGAIMNFRKLKSATKKTFSKTTRGDTIGRGLKRFKIKI